MKIARSLFAGELFQSDFVGDVIELLFADGIELFAARFEFFVDLYGLLGHLPMRVFGAAHKREVVAGGDAFVPVRIKCEAEQRRAGFLF